ncbi:hypothetical protein BD309DRAFT_979794 [Dichomitus squalens]|uniref:Uncharacterized protein n=1 Tax=Dichomitus squalens TaxID=114155 RepID=A0A4Q9NTZ7_9APHY|nr:hypothetical protein BD309DRAFT_979794 [Dichomitus squalens]TBU55971.1 hypothetical protein BD310DRAFT_907999 [Dichomitus squalens]
MLNLACFITYVTASNTFTSQAYGAINIVSLRVYAITLLSVLNSRETKRSITMFDSGTYGLNLIARAARSAAAETWNVPQMPQNEPPEINIKVTTELDGADHWDGPSKHDRDTASNADCVV